MRDKLLSNDYCAVFLWWCAVNPNILHACMRWRSYLSVLRYKVVRFIPCFVIVGWMQVFCFTPRSVLPRFTLCMLRPDSQLDPFRNRSPVLKRSTRFQVAMYNWPVLKRVGRFCNPTERMNWHCGYCALRYSLWKRNASNLADFCSWQAPAVNQTVSSVSGQSWELGTLATEMGTSWVYLIEEHDLTFKLGQPVSPAVNQLNPESSMVHPVVSR